MEGIALHFHGAASSPPFHYHIVHRYQHCTGWEWRASPFISTAQPHPLHFNLTFYERFSHDNQCSRVSPLQDEDYFPEGSPRVGRFPHFTLLLLRVFILSTITFFSLIPSFLSFLSTFLSVSILERTSPRVGRFPHE